MRDAVEVGLDLERGGLELLGREPCGSDFELAQALSKERCAERRGRAAERVRVPGECRPIAGCSRVTQQRNELAQRRENSLDNLLEGTRQVLGSLATETGEDLDGELLEPALDAGRHRADAKRGEDCLDAGGIERFLDDVVNAGVVAACTHVAVERRGQRDDARYTRSVWGFRTARAVRANTPARLEAVELGHLQVHQHEVVRPARRGLDRLDAVDGSVDLVAGAPQKARDDHPAERLVIDDEDRERPSGAF